MLTFQSLTGLKTGSILWIQVSYGEPAQLSISQQPSNSTGGTPLLFQPRIEVLDLGGARVLNASILVCAALVSEHALKLGYNPMPAQILGTTTVQVVRGFASFTDLVVNVAAHGYYFNFTSIFTTAKTRTRSGSTMVSAHGNHLSSLSSSFSILAGPPSALFVVQQPLTWTFGGQAILRQPSIAVTDAGGNPTSACPFRVSAQISFNGAVSGRLSGNNTAASIPSAHTLAHEMANFTDLSLDRTGAGYILSFRATLSAGTRSQSTTCNVVW
jgi:hypothetical protein